jgi:hypothetical protein
MKRTDIPTRKAVAYKARKYSNIEPAYVLDTERLWTYSRPFGGEPRKWAMSTETKFKSTSNSFYTDRYGDDGFLTIVIHTEQFDPPERHAAMREIEAIIAELPSPLMADEVRELDEKLPSGAWLGVMNNTRLVGEWLPALEAQTAARKAEDEKREADRVKRENFRDLVAVIEAEAAERGFETWRIRNEGDGRMSLPAKILADMLGIEMPEA